MAITEYLENSEGIFVPINEVIEERAKNFVSNFEGLEKEILKKVIGVPNVPNCQPEVLSMMMQYGENLSAVTDKIESLRKDLRTDYGLLVSALRKNIPGDYAETISQEKEYLKELRERKIIRKEQVESYKKAGFGFKGYNKDSEGNYIRADY